MGKQKPALEKKSPTLDSILSRYRPINADAQDIARLKRMYSRLPSEIYQTYTQAWECLMRRIPSKGKEEQATISNLGFLCLLDLERSLFLQQIIHRTISMAKEPGKLNVIDLGAGTGILGLTALMLGAGSVTLVENDKECLSYLDELLPEMGYQRLSKKGICTLFSKKEGKTQDPKKIIVYAGDAKTYNPKKIAFRDSPPRKYDLVICEMHETHLVSEDEIPALKNIKRYARPDAVFMPSADDLLLSVCDSHGDDLSAQVKIGSLDFGRIRKNGISFKGHLKIGNNGQAKYLKLWDRVYFPDNTVSERDFPLFTQTKYILLKGWEPRLKRGQSLNLTAKFRFGDRSYSGYALELKSD